MIVNYSHGSMHDIYSGNADFLLFLVLLLVKSYLFMLYPPSIIAKHFRYSWNKNVNKKNVDQKSFIHYIKS